jgi:glycosyltransferase involved in cell wall biosynthesis
LKPALNIIVPCYNPPPDWERALASRFAGLAAGMAPFTSHTGLVVVNDGSPKNFTEKSAGLLRELIPDVVVVDYPVNRGKGFALREGVRHSSADLHLVTDADFPYTNESMIRVTEVLIARGGIAAGNRDTGYYAHVPLSRRIISRALRWMLRNVLKQPIDDSQCGLKAFDNTGKALFLQTTIDRFLFDLEFLMMAGNSITVSPVPVELRPGVVFSPVNWKVLATEGGNFLKLLLRQYIH